MQSIENTSSHILDDYFFKEMIGVKETKVIKFQQVQTSSSKFINKKPTGRSKFAPK